MFESRPAREEIVYDVDVSRVAGFRLVSNTLKFLDEGGNPRLRVAPPYVVDASVRVAWKVAVYPAMVDPSWTATGSMANVRSYHTATLLPSGKVLVAGGNSVAA